ILSSDNMFIPQHVTVASLLLPGKNELRLLFESAIRRGQQRQAESGVLTAWNGDFSRLYVRKAQYHFGWDWGPCLITAGPWRPIRLEAYTQRIEDVHCPAEVAPDLGSAALPVSVTLASNRSSDAAEGAGLTVRLELFGPANEAVAAATLPVVGKQVEHRFDIASPELWWPRGAGAQPLYRLVATLQQDDAALDRREVRLGLRRLRLVQEPLADEPGTTFLFEVNNTPIFCGGANWIPADSFLPRISPERYRAWLQAAADANMNMLRAWGGGIYEDDLFYDLCDELGLLVWQDFAFACGLYPALDWFQASVKAEAEAAVRRLRHHPSLALWCGNNEDYQVAESVGAYDPAFEGDFSQTRFPAQAIYERLLPDVCAALDPTRPYWPGSPYGGSSTRDQTVGDRHTWDVWHGQMADYHDYPRFAGRFVSEFGMQSLPSLETIAACAPPEERYPQSRTLEYHNKATDGPRRLVAYLSDTVRIPEGLEDYVYATQFMQAEALGAAYRGWRRRWRGSGRYATAGALVWQLNDCWPVASWAIVDSSLHCKPAWYVIKRELAPLVIGLAQAASGDAEVWAVHGLQASLEAELVLRLWQLNGRQVREERRPVVLPANQATELGRLAYDGESLLVASAHLLVQGAVVARAALWPEPFKYLTLPDPELEVARLDESSLRLRANCPAKGVWLSAGPEVHWSDNMIDLLPGDEQIITAQGLGEAEVRVRWLR
ncbi:MAG TPA: glycoside hydrolase family 2 protein, partial [Ktedonobacterales bacterium]|nr:glycoside hydrolase family 2 protein [Ktedonobacterales bacterium]